MGATEDAREAFLEEAAEGFADLVSFIDSGKARSAKTLTMNITINRVTIDRIASEKGDRIAAVLREAD